MARPHSLIAWNAQGEVVATLDHMVAKNEDGNAVGLVDFAAHEGAGGRLRDIWEVNKATGSAVWPEWLGTEVYDFTVELDPNPSPARAHIAALVHKKSGHRRVRADIEAAISERIAEAHAKHRKEAGSDADVSRVAVDIKDIVGGPGKPLLLDDEGKTKPRVKVKRPDLPVIRQGNMSST